MQTYANLCLLGAAAVYCSDGRYGEHMDDFLHNCLGLPRYDRVAIPGGAGKVTLACHSGGGAFVWTRTEQGRAKNA